MNMSDQADLLALLDSLSLFQQSLEQQSKNLRANWNKIHEMAQALRERQKRKPIGVNASMDSPAAQEADDAIIPEDNTEASDQRAIAAELYKTMQCNCDLDKWEPERDTGHSRVCRIHKATKSVLRGDRPDPRDNTEVSDE